MNLLDAARLGNEQAVRELLAAGADPEAANENAFHVAAREGQPALRCCWRQHSGGATVGGGSPSQLTAVDICGRTPLDWGLVKGAEALPAARCLVCAAQTVQPTLGVLVRRHHVAATLYTDLVSRLALTHQEWQSIPAPCPNLAPALPAVIKRSEKETGWLVVRLGQEQRARLRTGALCLSRVMAGVEGALSLPVELSQHLLVAALADP
jgi:hypothetical protein